MGQIIVAGLALALAVFLQLEASAYPATAARLPNLLGTVVIVLALAAIVQAVLRIVRKGGSGEVLAEGWPGGRSFLLGFGFVVLIIVYAWSITHIGYLVATPLFLAIPLLVLRPVGLLAALITICAVTGMILGVFVWFLNLSIPLYPVL